MAILSSASSAIASESLNIETMDTSDLFSKTIDSVPECIEYCVDGVSLYMIITPFGISYYWTPNVSHNSPDILMMSHNSLEKTPYEDFNSFFGNSYKSIVNGYNKSLFGINVETEGGRSVYKKYGEHQSVTFKEASGVGHPASMILKMFGKGGLRPNGYWVGQGDSRQWHQCQTYGCVEEENSPAGESLRQELSLGDKESSDEEKQNDASNYLKNFDSSKTRTTTPKMVEHFGGNLKNMNSAAQNKKLNDTTSNIGEKVSSYGSVGQRIFCPINVTPFVPYYLSGLDSAQWRTGYPVTDPQHSLTITNPSSKDVIGANNEKWGYMFPREGTVNNPSDAKVGTVVAVRAASVLNDKRNNIRVVNKPDDSNHGFGGWGKLFPKLGDTTPNSKQAACHKKASNTGVINNENGGYAWTYWRRYNCDLRTTGIYITTVNFGPICLTSEVPN